MAVQTYKIRPREAALESIASYISRRGLKCGDRLPSEREMCDMWDLNRCTLRSAISRLERDGVVSVRRGAGIFVAEPKFVRNLQDLNSFTEETRLQERTTETRLLGFEGMECDKQFSRRFQVMLGTPLWKLSRLRSVDGRPILIETAFFQKERFPGIERFDFGRESLFSVFETEYGASPVQGDEKVSITRATAEEAELLDVADGAPVYWIVSQTYDREDRLLEYCRTVARADRLVLTSVLERREPT